MTKPRCWLLAAFGVGLCLGSATAQQTRDLSTPAKRLVGHWLNASDSSDHLYIGPADPSSGTGILTRVGSGGRGVLQYRYTISNQVAAGTEVTLNVVSLDGALRGVENYHDVWMNGQRMTRLFTASGITIGARWTYVDSLTAPPK